MEQRVWYGAVSYRHGWAANMSCRIWFDISERRGTGIHHFKLFGIDGRPLGQEVFHLFKSVRALAIFSYTFWLTETILQSRLSHGRRPVSISCNMEEDGGFSFWRYILRMGWGWLIAALAYGTEWRERRRAFTKYFHPSVPSVYQPNQVEFVRRMLSRLLEDPDDFFSILKQWV